MKNSQKNQSPSWFKTKVSCTLIVIASFVIGGLSTLLTVKGLSEKQNQCLSDLIFIKPRLDCAISDEKSDTLGTLQIKLETMVGVYKKNGSATNIGVFVRDLTTTKFAGVNENDAFVMASLLKTPLLIAGYKLAEVEPRILDQSIRYDGKINLYDKQYYIVDDRLEIGQTYSVRELMRRAAVYSDNTAAELLYQTLPDGFFGRILRAIGLQFKLPDGTEENFTSARNYANMFRLLYNASYLSREYSNDALKMLAETTYRKGATAIIPSDTVVSHKFAERTVFNSKTGQVEKRQLHECGLVYANKGEVPYTFCILTEGKEFTDLEKIQQEISKVIYDSIVD